MMPTDKQVLLKLARLRQDYISKLLDKLCEIDHLMSQLRTGTGTALDDLQVITHKLAGSAGTLGCPEVSAAARGCNQHISQLKTRSFLSTVDFMELEADYRDLQQVIHGLTVHEVSPSVAKPH